MKRYYSLKELYRKFQTYLRDKTGVHSLSEYRRHSQAVRLHLEWVKKCSLTIYSVTREKIKEYVCYLLSPENPHTKYYCRTTLQRHKSSLRYFYHWLLEQGILEENPFIEEFYKEMTGLIRVRAGPAAPEARRSPVESFREVYELACRLEALRGYNEKTEQLHRKCWRVFLAWLEKRGIPSITEVTEKEILDYQEWLREEEDQKKGGYRFNALARLRHLVALKALFEYLRQGLVIQHDPTHVVELPKVPRGIPHVLMSRYELEKLLNLADTTSPMGVRDRTVMEVFFSTGMRLNELCHLKLEDILFHEGMVRVMVPKGGKAFQRVVPIGRVALEWIKKYLEEVRREYVGKNQHDYLFINSKGNPLQKKNVIDFMKNYRLKGGFKKQITSHSFRVTCATEMLRNKADIRYVQQQLGHAVLQTTQIYTRVLPIDLKKVHQKTHPRERRSESLPAPEMVQK